MKREWIDELRTLLIAYGVMHETLEKIARNDIPPMPATYPPGTKGFRPVWGAMIQVAKDALAKVDGRLPEQVPPTEPVLTPDQARAKLVEDISDLVVARCKNIAWDADSKCRGRCPFEKPSKGKRRSKR